MDALTGRRLGGALFVLCGLVVAAIVLWPSGEDAPAPADADPAGADRVGARARARVRAPAHVEAQRRRPRDPAAQPRARHGADVHVADRRQPHQARQGRRSSACCARASRRRRSCATGPGRLGARPASTFELEGFGPEGRVRALVVVASSRHRTYAVTLLTPIQPSAKRLAQVQQILATVRLVEPRRGPPG